MQIQNLPVSIIDGKHRNNRKLLSHIKYSYDKKKKKQDDTENLKKNDKN